MSIDPSAGVLASNATQPDFTNHFRIVQYHQSYFPTNTQTNQEHYVSPRPLWEQNTGITHLILSAIHLNEQPGDITMNDLEWTDPRLGQLWNDARYLQEMGVMVMGMLGGAARGTYERLEVSFDEFYPPLREKLRETNLDGIDLDIEEPVSHDAVEELIRQLRHDFGNDFIITMSPVASDLFSPRLTTGGLDYYALENELGSFIDFYNGQFYNGWGSAQTTEWYDYIVHDSRRTAFPPSKIVLGVPSHEQCVPAPAASYGYVPLQRLQQVVTTLKGRYPDFGGVMGWEYFDAVGSEVPNSPYWSWAEAMTQVLRPPRWMNVPRQRQFNHERQRGWVSTQSAKLKERVARILRRFDHPE